MKQKHDLIGFFFFLLMGTGCMVFFLGAASADQTQVMADIHKDMIEQLQSQVMWLRAEAGVIITTMASALGALYMNSRRDGKASREALRELSSVLRERPCLHESSYMQSDRAEKEDPRED